MVDPLRLSQALANLLTNAAKYSDPGGHINLAATLGSDIFTIHLPATAVLHPRRAGTSQCAGRANRRERFAPISG
jgi:hypothetical protein